MNTTDITQAIYYSNVGIHFLLIAGVIHSIARPYQPIWPPEGKNTWQFWLTWVLFYTMFPLNAAIVILDWNSGLWQNFERLLLGGPLVVIGSLLVLWGIYTLGTTNTAGLKGGLVQTGPYRFTRNPQYLGDFTLFIGVSICSNSAMVLVTHMLTSLVFILAAIAEEPWLERQYGNDYLEYKNRMSRFI